MLFQINYTTRSGGSVQENEASGRRTLQLFSKWAPPAGVEIKSFYARADGRGGTLVMEADNAAQLFDGVAKFSVANEFDVLPIMDIGEAVLILNEASDWAASIE